MMCTGKKKQEDEDRVCPYVRPADRDRRDQHHHSPQNTPSSLYIARYLESREQHHIYRASSYGTIERANIRKLSGDSPISLNV